METCPCLNFFFSFFYLRSGAVEADWGHPRCQLSPDACSPGLGGQPGGYLGVPHAEGTSCLHLPTPMHMSKDLVCFLTRLPVYMPVHSWWEALALPESASVKQPQCLYIGYELNAFKLLKLLLLKRERKCDFLKCSKFYKIEYLERQVSCLDAKQHPPAGRDTGLPVLLTSS